MPVAPDEAWGLVTGVPAPGAMAGAGGRHRPARRRRVRVVGDDGVERSGRSSDGRPQPAAVTGRPDGTARRSSRSPVSIGTARASASSSASDAPAGGGAGRREFYRCGPAGRRPAAAGGVSQHVGATFAALSDPTRRRWSPARGPRRRHCQRVRPASCRSPARPIAEHLAVLDDGRPGRLQCRERPRDSLPAHARAVRGRGRLDGEGRRRVGRPPRPAGRAAGATTSTCLRHRLYSSRRCPPSARPSH